MVRGVSMPTNFLFDGPEDVRVTILQAHGAGAPMDHPLFPVLWSAR